MIQLDNLSLNDICIISKEMRFTKLQGFKFDKSFRYLAKSFQIPVYYIPHKIQLCTGNQNS